jgi:hypothetical protein
MRWITAVAVVLTAAVGIVVMASSAGGSPDPTSAVSALKTGGSVTLGTSTLNALQDAGFPVDSAGAVSVAAPDGGSRWLIVPGAKDGACLVLPDGGATCGGSAMLGQSGIVGFIPDEEASASLGLPSHVDPSQLKSGAVTEQSAGAPRGSIAVHGLVSDAVTTVAAVTSTGRVLGDTATITDNVFELNGVPLGQAASVRLTRADGTSTDVALR